MTKIYQIKEDADDEAAPEEQRRLARKQPRRDCANPREIDHGASPAERIRHFEYCFPRCAPGASSCAIAPSEGLIEQTCQSRLALHELFVGRTIILVAALPIANGFFGTQLATFFAQEIRHGSP